MKEGSQRAAASSTHSFESARSSDGDMGRRIFGSVRDLPTKRNLNKEFNTPADSRTGVEGKHDQGEVSSPNKQRHRPADLRGKDLRDTLEQKREKDM